MVGKYNLITLLSCVSIVMCASNGMKKKVLINAERLSNGRNKVTSPECYLRKDIGDCNENIKKYYYDISSGFCLDFNYTGCGGNLNNFQTLENCNSRCICSNPKDKGQGSKRITRYFYNTETEECQMFKYRGSGGNANRFLSLSQCENVCERVTLRRKCKQRPDVGTDCNNNSTVKFYYDKHCDCCREFTYLGCGGNRNRFPSQKICEKKCKLEPFIPTRPPKPALCFFQNVYGDCNALRTRYFYDNKLSRCVPFTYSGCGGNENNFLTLAMCKRTCEK